MSPKFPSILFLISSKLPPGINFGEVPGVAVDSKGNVYVFTRSNSANGPAYGAAAAQLLEFNAKGEFMREIGKGLYAWSEAHTVRIDKDDNIWAIDKGSDMVIKFNQAGRVVWVFGRKMESADGAKPWEHVNPPLPAIDGLFRQPTDVTWDSEGNIYITDGYVNSRVAKYDKNGDWVKSWGEPGTGPGQFHLPHAIVADRNNNLYVGRPHQPPHSGLRYRRQIPAHVHHRCATRSADQSCLRQYANRRATRCGDRRSQFDLHYARTEPGTFRRRNHLSRAALQSFARRQGSWRHRPLGT